MKRLGYLIVTLCMAAQLLAQTKVTISDPETWKYTELSNYIGQTIQFDVPFYVCNNYNNSSLTIAPRRIYQVTNQALPLSDDYNSLLSLNSYGHHPDKRQRLPSHGRTAA